MSPRPISKRIDAIYSSFYSEKAEDRFSFLTDYANKFCIALELPQGVVYNVSREKIYQLVKSYFLDVIRFKEYHFNPKCPDSGKVLDLKGVDTFSSRWTSAVHSKPNFISPSKIAAFSCKWIMKHAPISFRVSSDVELTFQEEYKINSANAAFAVQIIFEFLPLDYYRMDPKVLSRLTYHLMYRNIDDRTLFGWLENLQESALPTRKPVYNVFVASPDDCRALRDRTRSVINQINDYYPGPSKLNPYMWEDDKVPGATESYQDDVFAEAREKWDEQSCDILICFVWYRLGSGTKAEFNRFFDEMLKYKDSKRLFFCRYAGPIEGTQFEDAGDIGDLNKWVKEIEAKIAPLGGRRLSICTVDVFEENLRKQLMRFLNSQEQRA